jgi:outer membrane lipoprotein-sorting protein
MKKIYTLLLLLVFSSAFSQSLTSDEIIQKYIAAIGGIDELNKVKQITLTGKAVIMGHMTADMLAYEDAEEKYQFAHVSGEGFDVKSYFDLKGGWIMQNGVKEEATQEQLAKLKNMVEDGTYFYLTDMTGRGIKTEYMGDEKVDGVDCYIIKFTKNGEEKNISFFAKDTFYLVKVSSFTSKGNPVELTYSDYREVPGTKLKLPYVTEKGPMKGTVDKYEINVPLNPMLLIFDK